jgi:uncharacterized membrane protein YgcG
METMMAAGLVLSPIGLIICILIPTISILLARRPQLSAGRLVAGFIGALLALALAVGASSYLSPQDAISVWHVPSERYWDALVKLFVATFAVTAFASIGGISFVGIPVLVGLSNCGRATAPWLIIASGGISTVMAIIAYAFVLMRYYSSNMTFLGTLGFLVISHGIVTFGFALAARLPWAFESKPCAD